MPIMIGTYRSSVYNCYMGNRMRSKVFLAIFTLALSYLNTVPSDALQFKRGVGCVGRDKVAGICLLKQRKKYPLSVENNILLPCLSSGGGLRQAGEQCGCFLVKLESKFTIHEYNNIMIYARAKGYVPQKITYLYAECM